MSPTQPALSIIMPVLNEAAEISAALHRLQTLRGSGVEVIVVDGGSRDDTLLRIMELADVVLSAPQGRARQMNAGAAVAKGCILLFLHADTQLPDDACAQIAQGLMLGKRWGRFDVYIEGLSRWLRLIGLMMNLRSRWTGIATGDQAIFVDKQSFQDIGGYADIPLMEDIELSRRLCKLGRPKCLRAQVRTSGRRWETHGVWRTIWMMWSLRLRYHFGADPTLLAKAYGYAPR